MFNLSNSTTNTCSKSSGDLSWVPVTVTNSFVPGANFRKIKVCPLPAGSSNLERVRWRSTATSPGSSTSSSSAGRSDMSSTSVSFNGTTRAPAHTSGYTSAPASDQTIPREELKQTTRKAKLSLDPTLMEDAKYFLLALNEVMQNTLKDIAEVAFQWAKTKQGKEEPKYTYADYEGVRKGELPRRVGSLPRQEIFTPDKVGVLAKRGYEYAVAQMPFVARLLSNKSPLMKDEDNMWTGLLDKFRSVFETPNFLDAPDFIKGKDFTELEDGFLANQFINGCNPVVIEHVVDDMRFDELPQELRDHHVEGLPSPYELFKADRLFVADYKLLRADGVAEKVDDISGAYTRAYKGGERMIKYFYAPIVLLYRDEKSGGLQIYSIKLSPHKRDVYSKSSCRDKPMTYLFAKMHLACADNQYHQFATHLFGHLVWEPFSIAYQNVFNLNPRNKDHPVGKLLSKHFEGAIAINWFARRTLVATESEPLTDGPFAVGGDGAVAMIREAYRNWRFDEATFPRMLKAREFDQDNERDNLSEYYYRDDGMKVWKALKKYVQTVIDDEYGRENGDENVRKDTVLQEWCDEVIEKARVKGFPNRFEYKSKLVNAITTIIFHVSAQHAIANFAQIDYLSYVPNRPNALFRAVPLLSNPHDITKEDIFKLWNYGGASEPLAYMHFQVQFAYILSTPPEKTLMNMGSHFEEAYKMLKSDLHQIHVEIEKRRASGAKDYDYLDPYKIPPSIDI